MNSIHSTAPLEELATRAFLFGFPLVFDLDQVDRYVSTGIGKNPAAPWNQFSHARSLAGPEDTFVTINNDTVYSMAQLNLSGGPVRLTVPEADGRYYVLQLVSAWTDNFCIHRASGHRYRRRSLPARSASLGRRTRGGGDRGPRTDSRRLHRRTLGCERR